MDVQVDVETSWGPLMSPPGRGVADNSGVVENGATPLALSALLPEPMPVNSGIEGLELET